MPKEIQFYNPAFRGVQAQQGTMYIPDEGEVFFFGGSNEKFGDRNFNSAVNYMKDGQLYSIDPVKAYYNSPAGKLEQFSNELNALYGVNGALGGNYGSTPNFGDPWNYIRKYAADNKISGDIKYSEAAQSGGMKLYEAEQKKYWDERNAQDLATFTNVVNNSANLTPEQKKSIIDSSTKTYSSNKGIGNKSYLLRQSSDDYIQSTGTKLIGQDGIALKEAGYQAIQKDLASKGIDVNLSNLAMYNGADVLPRLGFTGNKSPTQGNIQDLAKTYLSRQQATGNIGAQTNIQGVGPGTTSLDANSPLYDASLGADKIAQLQAGDKAQQALSGTAPSTGSTFSAATVPSSTTPQGTIPGYKGVYADKKDVLANDIMVNNLFKQYHGRDANLTELNYWRTKKIGQLEDTLAKTQIFSKEDADRIRAQMAAEGKTYIANQAELEQLAKTGGISAAGLTSVSQQGGMLFNPAPVTFGSGLGALGSTTGASGTSSGASNTTGASGTSGSTLGSSGDAIVDMVADAVGDVNASETDILNALNKLKTSQIDPYYKQLISQAQRDVTLQINRNYEDRIRQLQTESFNMAENIKNTQKALEASGMTFSGEAISKLGTLSSFAQGTPAGLTPAQLGQTGQQVMGGQALPTQLGKPAIGLPTMTTEQMGIEGSVNLGNRLMAESSRTGFNRGLEDIGQQALRLLGSTGIQNLGLPAQSTANQPETTGTMQYDYNKTLQSLYGNLANQEGTLTDYQKLFL